MTSKEDQIRALLSLNALTLVKREVGSPIAPDSYIKIFNVSRTEVVDYALKHGFEWEFIPDSSAEDGFHLYRQSGRWHFFYTEKGIRSDEGTFSSQRQLVEHIVDTFLRSSGTGLRFTDDDPPVPRG